MNKDNKQNYQYIVTLKDILNNLYVEKLKNHLLKVLNQIEPSEKLKLVIDSNGGEMAFIEDLLKIFEQFHTKKCEIDVYCRTVKSSALILLTLMRSKGFVNKVFAYENALFMWHKPQCFIEFEGKVTHNDRFIFKGDIDYLLSELEIMYGSFLVDNDVYKKWEDLYVGIIKDAFIKKLKKEIEEEEEFSSYMARYRNLVDEVLD